MQLKYAKYLVTFSFYDYDIYLLLRTFPKNNLSCQIERQSYLKRLKKILNLELYQCYFICNIWDAMKQESILFI